MTSKRRSGTSSARRRPDVTFFLDRCLDSESLATALRATGAKVQRHREHFRGEAPDEEWLPAVGRRGWVVLTNDKSIRRNQLERDALIVAGVKAFVMTTGNLSGEEAATVWVRHLSKICNLSICKPAPFIAHVTRNSVRIMRLSRGR